MLNELKRQADEREAAKKLKKDKPVRQQQFKGKNKNDTLQK